MAADEFDSKFDLMQSSFGNHTNGSSGDGKLHMLYYNINEGWNGSGGYIAGFFYQVDISNNGLPILNIDTYPGVYYKNPNSGNEYKRMDDTYGTMVHEYQHLINYSNTSGMATWLNECFSAAAEEICYPGSSVVGRIQSWENYYYSDNNDWLNPPKEFEYSATDCPNLHKGYSLYAWSNDLDDVLALYSQVSFFAQYLYTRFGNTIYKQISSKYSSSETTAITNATGVNCADLARDFRVAVTANAAQDQYGGIYGFKVQDGYDPSKYNDVQSPWDLLSPVVFTGTSCSIKGGGAITVKPVNGVYNPPSGASANLKYIGIKLNNYTVTAESNNTAWGTVSVNANTITAYPADGYYVESAVVTEGTGTCTVSGNTIQVSASSDCTVLVTFAPKPSYTVNFVASGKAEGSQTALVLDEITLPATVSIPTGEWTFVGWMDHQTDETTEKPEYYAPGAAYTVTGNVTLYAVFTREEEGTGDPVYELVSTAPADWTGNYVITYLTTANNMVLMKGVTPASNGADMENAANAATYANAGVTLDGTTLSNVANDYVFAVAPHGSYYSIQSLSTGAYVGMNSNSSNMAAYTTYTASGCNWTMGVKTNAASALNSNSGSYQYLSYSTQNGYFWAGSSGGTATPEIRFWKETQVGITYYTTIIGEEHEHTPAAAVIENEIPATCTTAGSYDSVVYCSECGEELSRETVTVEALGHNFGEWTQTTAPTCTAEGVETRTCSRCGATETRAITATGHTAAAAVKE
ncbi:MAG: InlB B-repeat-containing protein, partial [Oscillospiraceae bacterium]|nr:InlB B-repeat-containing protein [Oscillospiraceae bacterium]